MIIELREGKAYIFFFELYAYDLKAYNGIGLYSK